MYMMNARWMVGLGAVLCAALAGAPPAARVKVDRTDPAPFTELKHSHALRDNRPAEWLEPLARHLQRRADDRLPPGEQLSVTFTDVQRAGSYEPWRGPRWDEVRVVKDIYPPRIDLRFRLTDADGRTLSEGERSLRDSAFLTRDGLDSNDPLRFEKRLLDSWLRKEFATPNG
jgi:hypothetical protein